MRSSAPIWFSLTGGLVRLYYSSTQGMGLFEKQALQTY